VNVYLVSASTAELRAEHALGSRPLRQPCVTATESALAGVMNVHVREYVRRIHEANGVPNEQAIDAADASSRSRALALDSTPGGHLRGLPVHNAAVREGEM
jgi:hypothetical protein